MVDGGGASEEGQCGDKIPLLSDPEPAVDRGLSIQQQRHGEGGWKLAKHVDNFG